MRLQQADLGVAEEEAFPSFTYVIMLPVPLHTQAVAIEITGGASSYIIYYIARCRPEISAQRESNSLTSPAGAHLLTQQL